MKAVVLTRTGGPDVLEVQEWPDPAVGAGEVRITVRAAGLNFADTMARVGFYPAAPKTPCVLGYEVAGEIDTIGAGVSGFVIGQRVMAGTRFGGQAELATAQARDVLPMPDNLSFEEGAAFCVSYATAYAALIIMGGLRAESRVLIHSAAGGVGTAATQIARNAGAEIFGTASASKHRAIQAQGVHHPIDYRSQDFKAEVRRLTDGEGVDIVMDAVRTNLVPQGLPDPPAGRPTDHVRPVGGSRRKRPQPTRRPDEPAPIADLDNAVVERGAAAEPESWGLRSPPPELVAAGRWHGQDHKTAAQRSGSWPPGARHREDLSLRNGR